MISSTRLRWGLTLLSAVAWGQTSLVVAPRQIALVAPEGSDDDAVETLTVSSTPPNLDFTASVRDSSTVGGWLSVSPVTGKTPATLTVSAKPGKLPPGVYTAQVVVTAGSLGAVANVVFSVGSTHGAVVASPTGLTFFDKSYAPVLMTKNLDLTVSGSVGKAMSYTATATSIGNWLTVSPFPATAPGELPVSASTTGLDAGTYTGAITIVPATGLPTVVPVTLVTAGTVLSSTPMSLSQTKLSFHLQTRPSEPTLPAADQMVFVKVDNDTVPFTATASDAWIRLSTVQFIEPSTTVSGVTPEALYVSVVPDGLTEAKTGRVVLSSPGRPSRELPVDVTVSPEVALNTSPSSVVLNDGNDYKVPVVVFATGDAAVTFTATPSSDAAPWLKVSPPGGSTALGSVVVIVSANKAALDPGPHTGEVVLTQADSSTAPITVPVRVDVTGPSTGPGALVPSATSLSFDGVFGVAVPAQTIAVDSARTGAAQAFTASASSEKGWLRVDPFRADAPATLTASVDLAAISDAGSLTGEITLTSLSSGEATHIPVSFNVQPRGLAASATALTFTAPDFGVAPPPQRLIIVANTPSTFSITGPSWIRVTPTAGPTPAAVSVAIDPSGLEPGTTDGLLKISGPDNELAIQVSVAMPVRPSATVSPDKLVFAYTVGSTTPGPAILNIGSSSGSALPFIAVAATASGGTWLALDLRSGVTPARVTVSVDASKLGPGHYSGTVVVTSANSDVHSIPVALDIGGSPAVQFLVHAATLAPAPMSPGLIMAITGAGLGPSTGVQAQRTEAGTIATEVAGTRVLFDGIPAPLLFVRFDQINAIVPYAVYGRVSTSVEVETAAGTSTPIDALVEDTAPGIFTAQGSGSGQAAALNADLTPNSTSNPADRGSTVVIFGTGQGQTDPPGRDGSINDGQLRRPVATVSATVGGKPAEVLYFGSAPYLVSGVFQANIRIPADADVGDVPVRIQVGSVKTQSNITVAVR